MNRHTIPDQRFEPWTKRERAGHAQMPGVTVHPHTVDSRHACRASTEVVGQIDRGDVWESRGCASLRLQPKLPIAFRISTRGRAAAALDIKQHPKERTGCVRRAVDLWDGMNEQRRDARARQRRQYDLGAL